MQQAELSRTGAELFFVYNQKTDKNVFLINGYSRSHTDFKAMMKYFTEQGIGAMSCDNRGSGQSVARLPFTIEDMVEDIIAVLDELKLEKVSFLGISMGGLILQKLLEEHSFRVDKVVLISTTDDPKSISQSNHSWPDNEEMIFEKMSDYFSESFVEKNKLLVKAMAKNIYSSIDDGDFVAQSQLQSKAIALLSLDKSRDPFAIPALVIHGALDRIIPFESGKRVAARFADATTCDYADAGHLLIAEKAKEMYSEVARFLQR